MSDVSGAVELGMAHATKAMPYRWGELIEAAVRQSLAITAAAAEAEGYRRGREEGARAMREVIRLAFEAHIDFNVAFEDALTAVGKLLVKSSAQGEGA